MESSVIGAKSTTEFYKAEESKKAAAVDLDSVAGSTAALITTAVDSVAAGAGESSSQSNKTKKKNSNRILVSNTKKPFVFYLSLAQRYIKQYNDIELTALGMAIPTVVKIAEALKRDGQASHKEVKISTVNCKENDKGRFFPKAKIQIVLGKAEKSDKTTAASPTTVPKEAADADQKA